MRQSIPGKERYGLNRTKNVTVTDAVNLKQVNELTEHLMTCYPSEVRTPGELIIHYKVNDEQPRDFVIRYDSKQMQAVVEKIPLTTMEDQGIIQKWGDTIYRINFKAISPKVNDKIHFEIARR